MLLDFFGLSFEIPRATFFLWTPWRATALEHRLFDALLKLPRLEREDGPDGIRLHAADPRAWRAALQAISRVLKGWQEESAFGEERRTWRWFLEGDTDANGFNQAGESFSLWGFLQVSVDRGGVGEQEKGEDIDLEGFGFRLWSDPERQ